LTVTANIQRTSFEDLYITTREKENRIYTDEQVKQLPLIEPSHIHFKEWEIRKRSAERLAGYLEKKKRPLKILEVGCGNGWLSAKLASLKGSVIKGSDINNTELEQARKVFKEKINLSFIEVDVRDIDPGEKFDDIIFAASIQYFPCFENVINTTLPLLSEEGEIHILDSFFYAADEIENARKRSAEYYRSIGYEEMTAYYFCHSLDSLRSFEHRILFAPGTFKNKYFGNNDPFPWICITKA